METECKTERNCLVRLIKSFKKLLESIESKNQVEDLKTMDSYISLKKTYEETERKLLDPDFFHCTLGKSFEDRCPDSEDEQIQQ